MLAGLHRDVQELHDERLKLWKDFNNSWLALLQRQFEDTQKDAAGVLAAGRNILPERTVVRLAEELIRLCDGVAQHGLVDYEMGVWEDEIISSKRLVIPNFDIHRCPRSNDH